MSPITLLPLPYVRGGDRGDRLPAVLTFAIWHTIIGFAFLSIIVVRE